MNGTYRPPETRDTVTRALLYLALALLLVNVGMTAYVFYVIAHTVHALQEIARTLQQPGG